VFVFVNYWFKAQGNFTWAETIALKVLPIVKSVDNLKSLALYTLAIWLMFCQVIYLLRMEETKGFKGSIDGPFYFLFVGSDNGVEPFAESPYTASSPLLLWILMLMIMTFSMWILNIFIGVVTDSFKEQVEEVQKNFQQARSESILRYLLRANRIPSIECIALGSWASKGILTCVTMICSGVVVWTFIGRKLPRAPSILIFTACVLVIELLPFQTKNTPWAKCAWAPFAKWRKPQGLHYLWLVKRKNDSPDDKDSDEETTPHEASSDANHAD